MYCWPSGQALEHSVQPRFFLPLAECLQPLQLTLNSLKVMHKTAVIWKQLLPKLIATAVLLHQTKTTDEYFLHSNEQSLLPKFLETPNLQTVRESKNMH